MKEAAVMSLMKKKNYSEMEYDFVLFMESIVDE